MKNFTDLTFFTNEEGKTLLDRFKAILKHVRFFDVLVGYFRISGFYQLYDSLESVEKIRILVGLNADNKTISIIESFRNSGEIEFVTHTETRKAISKNLIYEIEQAEDTHEVEEGIKKFIEWIQSGKIEIKAHPSNRIHAKVYISRYKDGPDFGNVITGSSNFSEAGLKDNYEFNVQLKNSSDVKYALERFEELWAEAVDIEDVYTKTISQKTFLKNDITPYEIYLKLLYEYFKADLSLDPDLFYEDLPENFMRLKYQEQAVINAKKILEEYGGVFLADVVGLGKTYMAALLAKQLTGRTLVIASPALLSEDNPNSWKNVFDSFKIHANFVSVGKLDKILERGVEKYSNVIIDEAHKFRNESNISYEKLSRITRGKKVILVTATPLNNSPMDILAQIKLFQKARNSTIPGIKDLEKFFKDLQKRLKDLDRSNDEFMEIVKDIAVQIRDKVLKHIMVRRTRREIEKYFKEDLKAQKLKFPQVADPQPIYYQMDEHTDRVFMETIKMITHEKYFKYARYTPLLYLKKQLSAPEETSQKNMSGFMKILLVKRLESSFYAFKNTLDRFIQSYEAFLKEFERGYVYVSKKHWQKIMEYIIAGKFEEIKKLIEEDKAQKFPASDFTSNFKIDLESDLDTLKQIHKKWQDIKNDPKLESFLQKLKTDKILRKNKLVIFTESKETAEYLKDELEKKLGEDVFLYHGGSKDDELKTVIENFDANAKNQKDDYRILVTTEVLSEGINLHRSNVVINYDIPWNPTRMIQRVGRINRLDTPFDKIYVYNFFPSIQANNIIRLKEAAMAKIKYFIEMLGNDAKLLTEGEEIKSFELFNKLTSKEYILGDEESEEGELKYFKVIENIKNKDQKLFAKIKSLPRKARVARKPAVHNSQWAPSLITYFRKGKLEKFYRATHDGSRELDFLSAVKLFEAKPETKSRKLPTDYYELLEKNKRQLDADLIQDETPAGNRGGRDNASKILKIIRSKEIKNYQGFTDIDEAFLKKTEKLITEGGLPKKTAKNVFASLKDEKDPKKILAILKRNIPNELFNETKTAIDLSLEQPGEVILSEYLIR